MPITLSDDNKKLVIASVRRYFSEELDQDIGDLKAALVLDFFLREVGPSVYNAAIADAQTYLRDRLADLEATCYEPEFAYWPKSSASPRRPG
jgi:uncharacterized protein (DUF2164 family)